MMPLFAEPFRARDNVFIQVTRIGVNRISIDLPYSCGLENRRYESTWSPFNTSNVFDLREGVDELTVLE